MSSPDKLSDEEVLCGFAQGTHAVSAKAGEPVEAGAPSCSHGRYQLTHGLVIRCRSACSRVVRKNLMSAPGDEGYSARFVKLLLHLLAAEDRAVVLSALELSRTEDTSEQTLELGESLRAVLPRGMTIEGIYELAEESMCKSINLSPKLQAALNAVPIIVTRNEGEEATLRFHFPAALLERVRAFMASVKRPEEAFDPKRHQQDEEQEKSGEESGLATSLRAVLPQLVALPREKCPECHHQRALYCGPCGGVRMPLAEALLPPRVPLQFDLVLLLHPAESLRHCTGIQAAVMGHREQMTVVHWPKVRDEIPAPGSSSSSSSGSGSGPAAASSCGAAWEAVLDALDPETDVLLFPDTSALSVSDWVSNSDSEKRDSGDGEHQHRARVVVIEASWNNSKAMFRQLQQGMQRRYGRPMRTVALHGLVGTYWKFHYEGSSAVSTIEAIVHCCRETQSVRTGGSVADCRDFDSLLWMLEYDRLRLLQRVEKGGKVPRAVEVEGTGKGSWAPYL